LNSKKLEGLAKELGELMIARNLSFTSAESCTGGWIGQTVTAIPGSSKWFGVGFITYSNVAKAKFLRVSEDSLRNYGAVSEQVVEEMVKGAILESKADLGVAISGIAGPGGGTKKMPVGTVCMAWKFNDVLISSTAFFEGDRNQVRYSTVEHVFLKAIELLNNN
jgi:nicotinamide-nucleotide amidase